MKNLTEMDCLKKKNLVESDYLKAAINSSISWKGRSK